MRLPWGDRDNDALDDGCENELAMAFAPDLMLHPQDGDPRRETYYIARTSTRDIARAVDIMYLLGYYNDPGFAPGWWTFFEHTGDSEFIEITVQYSPSENRWFLTDAVLSAHWNTINDRTRSFIHTELQYVKPDGTVVTGAWRRQPLVWASKDKHANGISRSDCRNFLSQDTCEGNNVVSPVYVDFSRNIGSFHDPLQDCVSSVASEPGIECFWDTAWEKFAGWQGTGGDTPYWEILAWAQYAP